MYVYQLLGFQEAYKSLIGIKFPITTSYKIAKIKKYIEEELSFYEQELQKIITEYGEKDENGQYIYSDNNGSIKIIPSRLQECMHKVNSLEQLQVQEPSIKLTLEDLSNVNLTPQEFEYLMPFLE